MQMLCYHVGMEQPRRKGRRFCSASYLNNDAVFWGTLLFVFAKVISFIQFFQEVADREKQNLAPPENYTVAGIVGMSLVILLSVVLFILLMRLRQGKLRMRAGLRYLLLNFLIVVWGLIRAIGDIADLFVFPELILILDLLAVIVAIIAPPVMLQLADIQRFPPDETLMLILGAGGLGFSAISIVIVAVILRDSYTFARLIPELAFRGGMVLYGLATLMKALQLRRELPIAHPVRREDDPYGEPAPLFRENEYDALYQPPVRPSAAPRDGGYSPYREPVLSQSYREQLLQQARMQQPAPPPPEEPAPRPRRRAADYEVPQSVYGTGSAARSARSRSAYERPIVESTYNVQRKTCSACGMRVPVMLATCPRCGEDV